MLGEKIGEDRGQVTGRRVLRGSRVETSFTSEGTLYGIAMQDMGTYVSNLREDGTLYGEGQGIVIGAKGERAEWTGHGVGIMKPDGSVSFRGAVYYYSDTPTFKKLNKVAALFEHEIDGDGNAKNSVWEWK